MIVELSGVFFCYMGVSHIYISKGHHFLDSKVMLGRSCDSAGSCDAYHVILQMGL